MKKSTAPALQRLRDHLFRVTNEVIAEVESGLHSGSPEAVAEARESTLREILSRFFPRTYDFAKGNIFDSHGGMSDSIDVVVLAANHPKLRNPRGEIEILLADGIQCAIELKPDLTDLPNDYGASRQQPPEIVRALRQLQSVKALRRQGDSNQRLFPYSDEYVEFTKRLPAHLVTTKGDPFSIAQFVHAYNMAHGVPVQDQLDTVLIMGKGLIVNTKCKEHGAVRADGTWDSATLAWDYGQDALAAFVHLLLGEPGPEMLMSAPVLRPYLQGMPPPKLLLGKRNEPSLYTPPQGTHESEPPLGGADVKRDAIGAKP